jgi:hypothetical protein
MRSARGALLTTALVLLAAGASARGDVTARTPAERPDDIPRLFSVRKSENRNRVDYGMRLDPGCTTHGATPVFAYWRMLESGPTATAPLRRMEHRAYGVASQRVLANGRRVALVLRALPERQLTVVVTTTPNGCAAETTLRVGGVNAVLEDVYVAQSGALSVDHIELRGRDIRTRAMVVERIAP